MEYEIYGDDIPLTSEVTDEYSLYADHENGCDGDKIVCFSLYTDGLITVEKIAWSNSDNDHVLSSLHTRFAVKSTMSFMAWYWRGQRQKPATTPQKNTTLDYYVHAPSGMAHALQINPTTTPPSDITDKIIPIANITTIDAIWSQLADGITLVSKKDGFNVKMKRFVDYEDQKIAIAITLANKEHFVASRLALFKFFKRHSLLNLHWFKAE